MSRSSYTISEWSLPDIAKAKRKAIVIVTNNIRNDSVESAPYQTGTLRRSILTDVSETQGKVGTNLPYARIREYGGTILPKNKPRLAWQKNWKWIFAKKVVQKWKPYLIPAYKKWIAEIWKILEREIEKATSSSK